jgi:hypothetical protein
MWGGRRIPLGIFWGEVDRIDPHFVLTLARRSERFQPHLGVGISGGAGS